MENHSTTAWTAATLAAALALTLAFAPAGADPQLTVRDDPGGSLTERMGQLSVLLSNGTRVRIVGRCDSACTMFLGLPKTCVAPSARLGFHGPQSQYYGIGLPPEEFEHWSRVMASHYPPRLAEWFMATGRENILGLTVISGAEAVALGARACRKGGE